MILRAAWLAYRRLALRAFELLRVFHLFSSLLRRGARFLSARSGQNQIATGTRAPEALHSSAGQFRQIGGLIGDIPFQMQLPLPLRAGKVLKLLHQVGATVTDRAIRAILPAQRFELLSDLGAVEIVDHVNAPVSHFGNFLNHINLAFSRS